MLLEQPANRLKAHLLERFAEYSVSCTGLCMPYRPRGEAETYLHELNQPEGEYITLKDSVDVQFIIRADGGTYDAIPTGGIGQNYRNVGNLTLVLYTSENEVPGLVESVLTELREVRVLNYDINAQRVASANLFLGQDFNAFTRHLVAFELSFSEKIRPGACTMLPVEICAPVEIHKDGVLVDTVPSGGAYIYESMPVSIFRNGELIDTIQPGGSYSYTCDTEIVDPIDCFAAETVSSTEILLTWGCAVAPITDFAATPTSPTQILLTWTNP